MNFAQQSGLNCTDMPAYVCDLSGARPTAATVDSLARLALLLRREGSRLVLRGASPELVELIAFMGLTEALGVEPGR
jgi:STAS domain